MLYTQTAISSNICLPKLSLAKLNIIGSNDYEC